MAENGRDSFPLEAGRWWSSCHRAIGASEGSKAESFPCLFRLVVVAGNPWRFLDLWMYHSSFYKAVFPLSLLIRTSVSSYKSRASLLQYGLILTNDIFEESVSK